MLGVGGVLEYEGSSPVDSAVVDALQRGQWGSAVFTTHCSRLRSKAEVLPYQTVIQPVKMLSTMQL